MTKKLYYHKTDGGAEYLCLQPIEGTDEGDLYTAVVRLDGQPELMGKFENIEEVNAELLDTLISILRAHDSGNNGMYIGEAKLCKMFADRARAAIIKATEN